MSDSLKMMSEYNEKQEKASKNRRDLAMSNTIH